MHRYAAPLAALTLGVLPLGPASVASAASPNPVQIGDMRLRAEPDSTRLVLDLSDRAEHTLFTLQNPDRIVIDIPSAKLLGATPAGQGMVKQIRVGARDDGSLRIVLDVTGQVQVNSFTLEADASNGPRLVVDLTAPPAVAVVKPVKTLHVPEGNRDLVIAVDAGHGGRDPGSIGKGGTREKDIALAVARLLAKRLDAEPGMRAVLTRDRDEFIMLGERVRRARAAKADMFISVHADAIHDRSITGSSIYILSRGRATSEAARWLADKENAADLLGDVSLDDKDAVLASVLFDLSQTASIGASNEVAEQVLAALDRVGTVRKPLVQQGSFRVLTAPDIPSILVETAYISNPSEEKRLRNARHQEKLADAIYRGVRAYFRNNPPPGTRFAALH